MLLTGTYNRTTDEKQRLSIPKSMREALGFPDNSVVYLAPGTDGSLALYTETSFSQLADQLGEHSPAAHDVRAFSRLFYAQAQRVEIDRQGRIRLPVELAQLTSLGKELVLIGVRDHIEIWDLTQWESYLADKQSHYDEIAERALSSQLNTPSTSSVEEPGRPTLPR